MNRSIFFILLSLFSLGVHAQVGLNTPTPNPLSVMDMENQVDYAGNIITPKGLMIPRMSLADRNRINVNLDKTTKGNGLVIYNTDEDCINYYSLKDSLWHSVCGGESNASFDLVRCGDLQRFGRYFQGITVNTSNYLTLTVSVKAPGKYSIIAKSTIDNGYYFASSGDALSPGTYSIYVPCTGTPQVSGTDTFNITLNGEQVLLQCPATTVNVEMPQAIYAMDCAATKIYGKYMQGSAVGGSNFMTLSLTSVDPSSFGANYSITSYPTAPDSSFYFTGKGVLTSNPQTVTLYGQGTPAVYGMNYLTINSNSSSGNKLCTDSILVKGTPTYTMTCASKQLYGTYGTNVLLTNADSITLDLNISNAADSGSKYVIQTDQVDGISFSGTGTLKGVGTQKVTLYGRGMPTLLGVDTLTLSSNSTNVVTCSINVTVSGPDYTLGNCSTVAVFGSYVVDSAVNSADSITLSLTVAPDGAGFPYTVWTDTISGISFRGTGTLVTGTQKIRLAASGIPHPAVVGPQVYTIKTDSKSLTANTCSAKVIIVNRMISVLSIGEISYYSVGTVGGGVNTMLTAPQNFGSLDTSTVYQHGWKITAAQNISDSTNLRTLIATYSPDIIVINYSTLPAAGFGIVIRRYLDAGGVVLAFQQNAFYAQNFLRDVLKNNTLTVADNNGAGGTYKLNTVNDPIMNGVFGDVRGKNWGCDASPASMSNNLPMGELTPYSSGLDISNASGLYGAYTSAFKHNTLNLIFFGDGGFLGSGTASVTSTSMVVNPMYYPLWYQNYKPIPKINYGSSVQTFSVQNSIIFMNAMAWGANQARNGGYNK